MSLTLPSRVLLQGAKPFTSTATPTTTLLLPIRTLHATPANHWFWRKKKTESTTPLEEKLAGPSDLRKKIISKLTQRVEGPAIFEDEVPKPTSPAALPPGAPGAPEAPSTSRTKAGASLVREHLARAVDPNPRARARWERKMLIRAVHRGLNPYSAESREARIMRTERQHTSRSPWLPTSVKKLVKLAHQITGKTVQEAIVQMRFSPKRMAQEVKIQLEQARNEAIAQHGMGLGEARRAAAIARGEQIPEPKVIEIQTKDGKWIKVDDPTRLYVAEAFVNRGPWRALEPEYRARGRMNILRRPQARITIVLKEEKTRIREYQERLAKERRQGPWIPLPDRPISAQHQHYCW